ncbi:hypothetical protein TNCV_11351, partial [Trichonephila clavipes]
MPAAIAKPQDR